MEKYISQETFDTVVWENINEFEMDPEEAIEDAVKQFKAQGVDLSKVIQDPKSYGVNFCADDLPVKQQIQNLVDKLKDAYQNVEINDLALMSLTVPLNNLKQVCDKGIAERCMATQLGAYEVLVQLLEITKDGEEQEKCSLLDELLITFSSYVNQQPDCVNEKSMKMFASIFDDTYKKIKNITSESYGYRTLLNRCILLADIFIKVMYIHEKNKCFLMSQHVHSNALQLVKLSSKDNMSYKDEEYKLIANACKMLCAFIRDDDVRVIFGQSYQHALNIANENQAIQILLNLIPDCKNDDKVCSEIFVCLSTLCVCEDVCIQVSNMNGVDIIFDVFADCLHVTKKMQLVKSGLQFLKSLCGSDKIKCQVMNHARGPQMIVQLMEQNLSNPGVSEIACHLVACLVLRHEQHGCKFVHECNIHQILCKVMVKHSQVASVQRACGMAIRNIVSRNEDLIANFLEFDAEKLLRNALECHGDKCRDEVLYALRDLHCKVQLRELWTGTGKHLDP